MTAQDLTFTIRLDDGSLAEAKAVDQAAAARLRDVLEGPKADRKRLRIRSVPEADTAGHVLANDDVAVSIALDYDVEGHTFVLRLPSAEDAHRYQKRLLITGVLAASIVAGAAGAQLASQQASTSQVAPISGPAISRTVTHDEAQALRSPTQGHAVKSTSAHDEASALKSPTEGSPVGGTDSTVTPRGGTVPQ